ncbi:carbohydrate-binding family 9-like protein [Carboxylicivirga sp. N1Y90]|uniref:carbohydrate-binding family 9-like protein n=1 Tax=Carboxylicivirga fragile TaxID=3417571 RepID=UPI003D3505C8|nr:carbohydrate-binding family 9-like protein [Marinilabiliaceae bacterium N1Y90]
MKLFITLCILIGLVSCFSPKTQDEHTSIDLTSEIYYPLNYIVAKCAEPLIIDGLDDDSHWENAPYTSLFIDIEGIKKPKYDTRAKMLWDNDYLYVFAKLNEPHIWGNLKQRDTVIFYNNDFEVFLDPSLTTYNYGEIEVNVLNTVWDLTLDKPYRVGGSADNSWDLDDLKTAISIEGTLNDPSDIDSFWTVEMAIPLKPLLELKKSDKSTPMNNEQWRINFSRVNWDHDITNGNYSRKKVDGKYLPEYNWVWSPQGVINMHEPEKWGYLQFSDQAIIDDVPFIEDKDLIYKQAAYAFFRLTRYGSLKQMSSKKQGYIKQFKSQLSDDVTCMATFEKTKDGFKYTLQHPTTNQLFIIDQDGWLTLK